MKPEQMIADLDAALGRVGRTVTVRRPGAPDIDRIVKASVRSAKPDELIPGVDQNQFKVILSPTGIADLLPLSKADKVRIDSPERTILAVMPIVIADVTVRIDLMVRGG